MQESDSIGISTMEPDLEGKDEKTEDLFKIEDLSARLKTKYLTKETWKKMYPETPWGILPAHVQEALWKPEVNLHQTGGIDTEEGPSANLPGNLFWHDMGDLFQKLLTGEEKESTLKDDSESATSGSHNTTNGTKEAVKTTTSCQSDEASIKGKNVTPSEANTEVEGGHASGTNIPEDGKVLKNKKTSTKAENEGVTEGKKKNPKLIQVQGFPGTGKTAALQSLAIAWSREEIDDLNGFAAILVIPLLQVDTSSSLLDILSSQLGLLEPEEQLGFERYLTEQQNASKVMFLIDDVGDKHIAEDSELGQLMKGDLHGESTVVAFTRVKLKRFNILQDIQPLVVFQLGAMLEYRVGQLMKVFFEDNTEQELKVILQKVLAELNSEAVMVHPLCLALVFCVLGLGHSTKRVDPDNLTVPSPITALYTGFARVILQHWPDIGADTTFTRSPLDDDSGVPVEIQNLLYKSGKLCLLGLVSDRTEFSESHLQECQLEVEDIERNPFFKSHVEEQGVVAYTRILELQFYLAALYLSYEGTQEENFLKIMTDARNEPAPLFLTLDACNLLKTVQLACGLSPQFFQELLPLMSRSQCLLLKDVTCEMVDVYLESSLLYETDDKDVVLEDFKKFLLSSPLAHCKTTFFAQFAQNPSGGHQVGYYQACLQKMVAMLDKDTCLTLLLKFCHLAIEESFIRRVVVVEGVPQLVSSGQLVVGLDQLQLELLSRFQFFNTQVLIVRSGSVAYFDIDTLVRVFKGVQAIDIAATLLFPYTCSYVTDEEYKPENNLRYLSLISLKGKLHLSDKYGIECILAQDQLKHLHLENVDMLGSFGNEDLEPELHLSELHLICQTDLNLASGGLQSLLNACRSSLKKLQLSFKMTEGRQRAKGIIMTELQELRAGLHQMDVKALALGQGVLQKPRPLWTYNTESSKKPSNRMLDMLQGIFESSEIEELGVFLDTMTMPFICQCVIKMKKLKVLAVKCTDLIPKGAEKKIAEALEQMASLKQLNIWKTTNPEYVFPEEFEKLLTKAGVVIELKVSKKVESLDEYVECIKIF